MRPIVIIPSNTTLRYNQREALPNYTIAKFNVAATVT
jgi:hypothetical protein